MNFEVNNLKQLMAKYSDDATCRKFLEATLWKGTPKCPKCGCQKSYKLNDGKTYKCANNKCYKKYTITVGTVFENTNIALGTWFAAIYLCTSSKKGVSSLQLHRQLGITAKTAWYLMHRIRKMMQEKAPQLLRNVVEADETYIGGKYTNMHKKKLATIPMNKDRHIDIKTPVVGLCEPGGRVYAEVVDFVSKRNIKNIVDKNVAEKSILVTDEHVSYKQFDKKNSKYQHETVVHSAGEYMRNGFHVNSIEGFWSLLKRGVYGIYHSVSPKHLSRYCHEFSCRYNTRKITDNERFQIVIANAKGNLPYKTLISQQ